MLTNSIFPEELLPALRRSCHTAICDPDVKLPRFNLDDPDSDRIRSTDIKISSQLNKDVLDKCCVFVVYSEAESSPNVSSVGEYEFAKHNEGTLLRGGMTSTLNHMVQITVYSQTLHMVYQIGDLIVSHINEKAQRRSEFRYFVLTERHGSFNEDVNAWVGIYKMKLQLQPVWGVTESVESASDRR